MTSWVDPQPFDTFGQEARSVIARLRSARERDRQIAEFVVNLQPADEDTVFTELARFLVDQLRIAEDAWIYKVGRLQGGELRVISLAGCRGSEPPPSLRNFSRGSPSTVVACVNECKLRLVTDCSRTAHYPMHDGEPPLGAVIAIPMVTDGECIGAIWLHASEPDAFNELDDVPQLYALARNASLAVGNLRQRIELEWLATHDPLTELYNRRGFQSGIDVVDVARQSDYLVLFADIDSFKSINSDFGYKIGDQVVREVGLRLKGSLGTAGIAARWGGEEFVMVIQEVLDPRAQADRLVQEISSRPAAGNVNVTISLGAAVWAVGDPIESAIRKAEAAERAAKEQGKNRAVLAE